MGNPLSVRVEWSYWGKADVNVGPGATRAEKILPFAGAAGLATFLIVHGALQDFGWAAWQWGLALLLAFDIGGGVVANSLNSCKRFYHSPVKLDERGLARLSKNHALFVGLHIHPVLLHLAWSPGTLPVGLAWYAALLCAACGTMRVPLYLARPFATLCVSAAIVGNTALEAPQGLQWLMPLLFLKIVLGHCTREEPYRPIDPSPPAH